MRSTGHGSESNEAVPRLLAPLQALGVVQVLRLGLPHFIFVQVLLANVQSTAFCQLPAACCRLRHASRLHTACPADATCSFKQIQV